MENPATSLNDALPKLAKIAKKLPEEINDVINDLSHRGILELKENRPPRVVRDKIWAILKVE